MAEKSKELPFRDDSENEDVQACRRLLTSAADIQAHLDVADLLCARYYHGQQWSNASSDDPYLPQTTKSAKQIRTVANQIAPNVDQWKGRLQVNDWWAKFWPDPHHPHTGDLTLQLTSRQKQAWWDTFYPYANISGWQRRGNLRRLVLPSGGWGTYDWDEYAPGGVKLRIIDRLTLDPANPSPDLDEHEEYVDSRVISLEEFKAGPFGKKLAERGIHLDTGVKIADLRTRESYLGRALFGLQPGGHASKTTGVIVHIYWRKKKGRMERMVLAEVIKPRNKKGEEYEGVGWFLLEKTDWLYGTAYIRWLCHDIIGSAWTGSLVGRGIAQQDVVSMVMAGQLYDLLNVARKIVVQDGTIANMRQLKSSERWGVVRVKRHATLLPTTMQGAMRDPAGEQLLAQALMFLRNSMSVQEPMLGIGVPSGRRPHSETTELIQQGATPIADVAARDYDAANRFFNRLARAAVLHYGRTSPGKLMVYVGQRNAPLTTLKVAMKALQEHEGICILKREAFLAQSPEEILMRLDMKFQAGRMTKWEYDWEVFLRTGFQAQAGQETALHNAEVILYEILHGQRDPDGIRSEDNHTLLLYLIARLHERRVLEDYDDEQLDNLERAALRCKQHLFENGQMEEAMASLGEKFGKAPEAAGGMGSAGAAGGPAGLGGAGAQGDMLAVGAPPIGGGVAAAAG